MPHILCLITGDDIDAITVDPGSSVAKDIATYIHNYWASSWDAQKMRIFSFMRRELYSTEGDIDLIWDHWCRLDIAWEAINQSIGTPLDLIWVVIKGGIQEPTAEPVLTGSRPPWVL